METDLEQSDRAGSKPPKPRRKSWYARCRKALVVVLVFYLTCMVVLMFLEESLIFFPSRYPEGDWEPLDVPFEDAWFQAADGTRLHGWYAPHDNPRAVILFCHGNAGNVTHRADTIRILNQRVGASVLLFDYRGYGRSEGKPNESGVLADARAAQAWLAERSDLPEEEIVVMGRSLGGAVAIHLAAENGARALVVESAFSSIPDMAAHLYPWLPVRMFVRTKLDAASEIPFYEGPLLQSHGDADSIVPHDIGRRLFEAANEPKQFITIAGRDHNDPQPADYYDTLIEFLDGLP